MNKSNLLKGLSILAAGAGPKESRSPDRDSFSLYFYNRKESQKWLRSIFQPLPKLLAEV